MTGLVPTAEQQDILDAVAAGGTVAISACAGTGKTSTLRLIAEQSPDRRMLYVAFNKAVQVDAAASFPNNVKARTAHALAYPRFGPRLAKRLDGPRRPGQFNASVLGARSFGAGEVRLEPAAVATMAMATVARFCRSADAEVNASHFSPPEGLGAAYVGPLTDQVVALAHKAWADLTAGPAGKLRPTHDTYLKQWQLSGPHLDYDVVLYDEAQDADACVADVVSRQSHAQLVAVGDSAQAIYGWRGAGDFLATVAARHRLALTQSWRFGQAIADEANVWLGVVGSDVRVVGNPSRSSVLSKLAHPDAVLCRSNAATIDEVLAAHATGTKVHLEGDGTEMAALARAAQRMQDGQPAEHPELAAFPDWAAVQAYAENDPNGTDLAVAVRMIDGYGAGTVIEAIEGTVPAADATLVVSTAHKSKGLEWAKIRIADDFRQPRDPKTGELLPIPKDMAMLGYVAVTRGREVLDTGGLSWVHGHLDALGQSASGCAVVTTPPIGPGSEPQAKPAGDEEPDGVAAQVGELLGRLDELSREAIGPLLELGADSIAVARLERSLAESREALAAVASATETTATMAADIVGVLHQALGEGRAHLCDQEAAPRRVGPGRRPSSRG